MTLYKQVIVKVKYFIEPYPIFYRALRFFYRLLWKKELAPSAENRSSQEPHFIQPAADEVLPDLPSIPLYNETTPLITLEDISSNKMGYISFGNSKQVVRSSIVTIQGPADEEERVLKFKKIFADVNYISHPLKVACFSDAIVDLDRGTALTQQQLIEESLMIAQFNTPNWRGIIEVLLRNKDALPVFERPLLHCFHCGGGVYGHFILDVLLLLNQLKKALQAGELTILIPNYIPEWPLSIMKELQLPETAFYRPRSLGVVCDRLFVSSALNSSSTYFPDVDSCHALRETFLGGKIKNKNRHIFLSRLNQTNNSKRELKNEQAVHDALVARGFEILEPSNMPFQEQVRAFAEASVIVGCHGSSFGNLIFAQPGTHIVDLMPLDWLDFWGGGGRVERWLLNFTTVMQLHYHLLLCHSNLLRPLSDGPSSNGIEFNVDINSLEELLNRIATL